NVNVPVLTKNQRYHYPIISRAHRPICTRIAHKCFSSKFAGIRPVPVELAFTQMKLVRCMMDRLCADWAAPGNKLSCPANQYAIHKNFLPGLQITNTELVFCSNTVG